MVRSPPQRAQVRLGKVFGRVWIHAAAHQATPGRQNPIAENHAQKKPPTGDEKQAPNMAQEGEQRSVEGGDETTSSADTDIPPWLNARMTATLIC
jgi:hypothetical protein